MYQPDRYPRNWKMLALACKERANWQCCQGRCNHEPILNWPPWLNELQRTTTMSAGEQTPTKLRQNQVIPTPTHKRRLPNASRLAASGAQSHFR
jgi:hypothetical protein